MGEGVVHIREVSSFHPRNYWTSFSLYLDGWRESTLI